MISFHPTINYRTYIKLRAKKEQYAEVEGYFQSLFPNNNIALTDSGKSALAVIIESLKLQNKKVMVPAFICNALLPIFQHYNIKPVFVDVDINSLQPNKKAYTSEKLNQCDAVLLVPTYGNPISQDIYKVIKGANKIIIEDYAHCSLPSYQAGTLFADARYYSLTKILPVPDGGVVISRKTFSHTLMPHRMTLSFIKEMFKLFSFPNFLIARLKEMVHKKSGTIQKWYGIRKISKQSIRLMHYFLCERKWQSSLKYCYPIFVNDPEKAKRKLFKNGIISERIWLDPIVCEKGIVKNKKDYPSTLLSSQFLICAPGWHIKTQKQENSYKEQLKKILSGNFRCFRQEKQRGDFPKRSK